MAPNPASCVKVKSTITPTYSAATDGEAPPLLLLPLVPVLQARALVVALVVGDGAIATGVSGAW